VSRWNIIRADYPNHPAGYIGGAVSLRELQRDAEADALLQDAMKRLPDQPSCAVEYAWLRHAKRDWQGALPRWIAVCERFPDQQDAWLRRALAEIELWQYDAAEATLAAALAQFPDEVAFAAEYAGIAMRRSNWAVALERFAALRARFPRDVIGFTGAAKVLKDQFRLDEADALLEDAIATVPQDPRPRLEHALLPVVPLFRNDRRYDITLLRLSRLRQNFPTFLDGFVTSVAMLRELKLYDAAELVAASWVGLPGVGLAIERARVAEARGDAEAAIAQFTELRNHFRDIPAAHVGLAGVLSRNDRHDEADAIISDALVRFPYDAGTAAEHGQVAASRHDWSNALARWTAASQRFPDDQQFAQRIYEAQTRLSEMESDPDTAPPVIDRSGPFKAEIDLSVPSDVRQQMRDLAMQFESLGGRDIGCEFGMVQRACGAEPLGLLRWADMTPEALTMALENRFEGVGEAEHTELFLDGLNRPEYCTRDRRGMMYSRTFRYADEIPFDKMYRQSCHRLKFLKRKLIDDLENNTKIFVYRFSRRNLNAFELNRIHTAMRNYGENTLLYLRYADAHHPPNTVERAGKGLLVAYMAKFKVSRTGELEAEPPTDAWMTVCRAAYALWTQSE
jgi:tetratricopeptide (TPR) repeat protein